VLVNAGFKPLDPDPCIYIKRAKSNLTIISVYVDDLLIIGTRENVNATKEIIKNNFKCKDLGEVKYILGIEVKRDRSLLMTTLNQRGYIEKILQRFHMDNCKPLNTPMSSNWISHHLKEQQEQVKDDGNSRSECDAPFRQAIGALQYLSQATRPDIAFCTNILSRYLNNYNETHWSAVKRIFRYLQGTKDLSIKYIKSDHAPHITGFCDADWANNPTDRKSITGYVFMYVNGPVMWKSKRQSSVALSSTEAELFAISEATKQSLYIRKLITSLGIPQQQIKIYNDNQSSIIISSQPSSSSHPKLKHSDVRLHHIKDTIQKQFISLNYCPTDQMIADILTKPVSTNINKQLRDFLNLSTV
jgi:hypothetical protein